MATGFYQRLDELVCKGDLSIGTGCKQCSRCRAQQAQIDAPAEVICQLEPGCCLRPGHELPCSPRFRPFPDSGNGDFEIDETEVTPEAFTFLVPQEPCSYWGDGHIVARGVCRCGKRFRLMEIL